MTERCRSYAGLWCLLISACNVQGPLLIERPSRSDPPEPSDVPAVTSIQTSWLGNSFGGAERQWMPRRISGLVASPDGTLFLSGEDLAHNGLPATRILKHGNQLGELLNGNNYLSAGVGMAIAGERVFAAVVQRHDPDSDGEQPGDGMLWNGVRLHAFDGSPLPFATGRGPDGSILILDERADSEAESDNAGRVTAIAASGSELFVAASGRISVFDSELLEPLRSFALEATRGMAIAPDGTLWAIAGQPPGVVLLSALGEPLMTAFENLGSPVALAFDTNGQLLIADEHDKQVHRYAVDSLQPRLVQSYGAPGGLSESGGVVARDRWLGLSAIAADGLGNLYVGMNTGSTSGARVVAMTQGGQPQWELSSVVNHEGAGVDLDSDGLDIVTTRARFRMDYARPPGQQASWRGWSLDWERFPNDPRLGIAPGNAIAARVGGQRFLYNTASAPVVSVFREEAGSEYLVPAVQIGQGDSPERPMTGAVANSRAWLWRDADGDGNFAAEEYEALDLERSWAAWVDERGTIWRAGESATIEAFATQTVDGFGVPQYTASERRSLPIPAPFERLQGIQVSFAEDAAYLAGYTVEQPNPYGDGAWTSVGTELIRYDDWATAPRMRWRLPLLLDQEISHRPWAFAATESRIFVTYVNDEAIYVFDAMDGSSLGKFEAGPEVNAWLGTSRTWMSLMAFQRRNRELLLFAADNPHSKVTLFRIPADWPY